MKQKKEKKSGKKDKDKRKGKQEDDKSSLSKAESLDDIHKMRVILTN